MKPSSIKDIARALGISIGTVDRALHERPGISAKTRASVLKMAEELGYRPNLAARSLKLNRRLKIGVYFPEQIASFFDQLRNGVRSVAATATGVNVDLLFRSFPRLDEGDVELLNADADRDFDGILVVPGNSAHIEPALRHFTRRGVCVVCVANDAPHSGRLACVTTDAFTGGAIAAELFSRVIEGPGTVAAISGDLTILDHAEKFRGFAANLAVFSEKLTLLPAIEYRGQPDESYERTRKLIARKPLPLGIYISTSNSLPVLRALEERSLLGKVQVITTDLFPELAGYIESGKVMASLYQRPFRQGKTALDLMLNYLIYGVTPAPITTLAPHIVLRSNLALFNATNR